MYRSKEALGWPLPQGCKRYFGTGDCSQQYHLNDSYENWNNLGTLVKVANKRIRKDHRNRHEKPALELDRNPPRLTRTLFP